MSLGPVNSAQCPVPSRIVPCPSHVGVAIMIRASLFHWLGGRTLFARRWWDLYWFEQNANVHEIRQSSPCLLFCFVFYFYYLFYFIFYCFILFCLIWFFFYVPLPTNIFLHRSAKVTLDLGKHLPPPCRPYPYVSIALSPSLSPEWPNHSSMDIIPLGEMGGWLDFWEWVSRFGLCGQNLVRPAAALLGFFVIIEGFFLWLG